MIINNLDGLLNVSFKLRGQSRNFLIIPPGGMQPFPHKRDYVFSPFGRRKVRAITILLPNGEVGFSGYAYTL